MFIKGDVISFRYLQPNNGESKRFGKVLSVVDTNKQKPQNTRHRWHDANFQRSQLRATIQHVDGSIKSYYVERSNGLITYPALVGRVLFGVRKFLKI